MDKIELQSILTWYGSGKLKDDEAIELICALENKAENERSNCDILHVGNQRELLIAFADWYKTTDFNCEGCYGSDCVDEYLKSN